MDSQWDRRAGKHVSSDKHTGTQTNTKSTNFAVDSFAFSCYSLVSFLIQYTLALSLPFLSSVLASIKGGRYCMHICGYCFQGFNAPLDPSQSLMHSSSVPPFLVLTIPSCWLSTFTDTYSASIKSIGDWWSQLPFSLAYNHSYDHPPSFFSVRYVVYIEVYSDAFQEITNNRHSTRKERRTFKGTRVRCLKSALRILFWA